MRDHVLVPEPISGYVLNPDCGFWAVIVPEATTNLITNPSFETNTTGYTAVAGAALARVATQQRRGVYALRVIPTSNGFDGVYYELTLAANTLYTVSLDLLGAMGRRYRLFAYENATGASAGTLVVTGTGHWQRVHLTFQTTSNTTWRLYLSKNNEANTEAFYTDGWQLEQKGYPTTYTDGDLKGFVANQVAFAWSGTAHASTSTRSAQTRAGGRVVNFDDLGLRILSYEGAGMEPIEHVATARGVLGGARYQRTIKQARSLVLVGALFGATLAQVQRGAQTPLQNALRPDTVAQQQPLVLRYQAMEDTRALGDELDLVCHYAGGLEGETTNLYQERVALQFTQFLPAILVDGNAGATLGYSTALANANGIVQRSPDQGWRALGTGIAGGAVLVYALAYGLDGSLYVGGDFTTAGGVTVNSIARWNGTAWAALGTGMNGQVRALAVAPNGDIYAAGAFTTAGGVAANRIARWNGSAWSALGTGLAGGDANALIFGTNGILYAGGNFTTAGGAGIPNVAQWNGAAWSAVGTGLNGTVYEFARQADGQIYATGTFAASGATTLNRIGRWDGAAWNALGSGLSTPGGLAVAVGPDGIVYVTGDFTTAGGVSALRIAQWNGTSWAALGSGLVGGLNSGNALAVTADNQVYAGGSFTTAGGLALPDSLARWARGAWAPVDIDLPGTPMVEVLLIAPDGSLTVGFPGSGTAQSAVQAVTNSGTAETWPRVVWTGPGQVFELVNETTGHELFFTNLTLLDGEVATLDLTPGAISFTSNFRGNLLGSVAPNSQLASWRLLPGVNYVSSLMGGTTANTAVAMQWRINHHSVEAATR